jgi:hypothetical protein
MKVELVTHQNSVIRTIENVSSIETKANGNVRLDISGDIVNLLAIDYGKLRVTLDKGVATRIAS